MRLSVPPKSGVGGSSRPATAEIIPLFISIECSYEFS